MKKTFILFFCSFYIFISCSSYNGLDSQRRFLLNEKSNDKYYIIEFINSNQGKLGETPTLIINTSEGMLLVRSDNKYSKKLNFKKKDITRMIISSDKEKGPSIYGSAGKYGVVAIDAR